MYWILWLVLMIAIPLLAGIPPWMELNASTVATVDEADDRRDG